MKELPEMPDSFLADKPQDQREISWSVLNRLLEKPEVLDRLIERLESEDFVD